MPLDLRGFTNEPQQWAGLYHAADQLEKNRLKADQLAAQQQAKKASAGAFLQNYLDPKDMLSGTQFDPMILQGLQTAMQQGAQLAAAGADAPTLMMALGPMVNKLTTYSTNAKNISKQVDDQIAGMKASGLIGYDFSKIKEEALKSAFYKTNAEGQLQLDPDHADPSVDWVTKAIQENPEKVTTGLGFDTFADKAKMKEEASSIQDFDRFGNMDRHDVNLKYQEYMVPERDGNKVKGFVPKYQTMVDNGQPLLHTFTDKSGKPVKDQVRVLDEGIFDGLPPGLQDYIKGQVKQHIGEYETATGERIPMGSPKAKLVARALAYDELNRPQRNFGAIGSKGIFDKPSPQQIRVNVGSTKESLDMVRAEAQARTEGRLAGKGYTPNSAQVIGEVFKGNSKYLTGDVIPHNGRDVIEITNVFPGGGLKAGRGDDYEYRGVFFDPKAKSLIVEQEKSNRYGGKTKTDQVIPEKDIGKFIYKIAESNGIEYSQVEKILDGMGYKNGSFSSPEQQDFDSRKAKKSWRDATNEVITKPFGQGF